MTLNAPQITYDVCCLHLGGLMSLFVFRSNIHIPFEEEREDWAQLAC